MRTSFHYQPEAQHPNSSALHKLPADYPIFRPLCRLKSDISRGPRSADFVAEVAEGEARCALAPRLEP